MHICVPCLQLLQSFCLSPPPHSQTSDNLHRGGTLSRRSPLPASGLSYHHPDRAQSLWYVTLWRLFLLDSLFMTDLYHLNDLKKKKVNIKADTRKHFWMQFMTHQLEICSQLDEISASLIKMNGNPLLWLHRLTAPDVQYVCWIYSCPVTGHWFAVRSLVFSDSELGPMILVKLMDLIESTGQRCTKRILVKLVYSHYLCISFFFFPTLPNPELLIKPDSTFKSLQWCMSRIRRLSQRELHILNLRSLILSRIFHN